MSGAVGGRRGEKLEERVAERGGGVGALDLAEVLSGGVRDPVGGDEVHAADCGGPGLDTCTKAP